MRYAFVVNEEAGRRGRDPMLRAIRREFGARGCDLAGVPRNGAGGATARRAADSALVAVGGDGTVNRLLPLAARSGVPLGILPAGTANDLARWLGVPASPARACRFLRYGVRRPIDLLAVNGALFATCGGLGAAAEAADLANRWRHAGRGLAAAARACGPLLYAIAAARALLRAERPPRVTLTWDRGRVTGVFLTVLASNVPCFGARFRPAPLAEPDDGLLDLCLVPDPPDLRARLRLLRAALRGDLRGIEGLRRIRTRRAEIRTDRPVRFFGDGEILAEGTHFLLETRAAAINVIAGAARPALTTRPAPAGGLHSAAGPATGPAAQPATGPAATRREEAA